MVMAGMGTSEGHDEEEERADEQGAAGVEEVVGVHAMCPAMRSAVAWQHAARSESEGVPRAHC